MLFMLEIVGDAGLPLPIGLERALGLLAFALSGMAELLFERNAELPLIGVMVPELPGIAVPVPTPLILPLLPRGMKDGAALVDEGILIELPDTSSVAEGTVVLWFFWRWPKTPIPLSAFPPI